MRWGVEEIAGGSSDMGECLLQPCRPEIPGPGQWPARIIGAVEHRLVDGFGRRDAILDSVRRPVGNLRQGAQNDLAGSVGNEKKPFVESPGKTGNGRGRTLIARRCDQDRRDGMIMNMIYLLKV